MKRISSAILFKLVHELHLRRSLAMTVFHSQLREGFKDLKILFKNVATRLVREKKATCALCERVKSHPFSF
jgi:hypothetical protein